MGDPPKFEKPIAKIAEYFADFFKFLGLRIDGVEVTQSIQYSRADRHLTDPADRGPDNSVPLVAGKPAWVRVYVRGAFGPLNGVTGTLRVSRRHQGFHWLPGTDLSPQPPGMVTAQESPDYATERADINASLNFVIPAEQFCGHLRLEVNLEAPGGYSASETVYVEATLSQTLRLRIIPVAYNGPDSTGTSTLNLAAPDLATSQATAAWSLLVYPVRSEPDITLTASVNLTFPLTGSPASAGGCAQSWIDLNVLVAEVKAADGNQANTFYYGLVPAGVPLGANSGCASSGVTSGVAGLQATMAHEVGHALGFPHAPCGGVGASADTTYPAYEPYDAGGVPGGSIGEYGLDINTGLVHSPVTRRDFMSYCSPRWISLYNYGRSVENQLFGPTHVCEDEPWWWDWLLYDPFWWVKPPEPPEWFDEVVINPVDPMERVISIVGVHDLTGEVQVRSLTRTVAVPTVHGGERTHLTAELMGERGERLAAAPVYRLRSQGCCGSGERDRESSWVFQAFLPDVERGSAIRLVAKGEEVWQRGAPPEPPQVTSFRAELREDRLQLAWQLGKDDQDAEVWVRSSEREGPGRVLHVSRGSGEAELDVGNFPPGTTSLELVAHDGFHITTSEAVRVEVPERGPVVTVFHPHDRQTLPAGGTIRLHGVATTAEGQRVSPDRCRWVLDGSEVGRGLDVWIEAPEAGDHSVTLEAEDEFGRADRTVDFRTVAPDREPPRDRRQERT